MTTKMASPPDAPVNDNTTMMVVWSDGGPARNYVMYRYYAGFDANGCAMTGEINFGKKQGLWLGYAIYDAERRKYVFTRVRELEHSLIGVSNDNNESGGGGDNGGQSPSDLTKTA